MVRLIPLVILVAILASCAPQVDIAGANETPPNTAPPVKTQDAPKVVRNEAPASVPTGSGAPSGDRTATRAPAQAQQPQPGKVVVVGFTDGKETLPWSPASPWKADIVEWLTRFKEQKQMNEALDKNEVPSARPPSDETTRKLEIRQMKSGSVGQFIQSEGEVSCALVDGQHLWFPTQSLRKN